MIAGTAGVGMSDSKAKIRLYVDASLGAGQSVSLNDSQSNYLFAVMRLSIGDSVLLFNGTSGEWLAEVVVASKRSGHLVCSYQTLPQSLPPDLWLLFAPLKKLRTDMLVEKAVELGVARLVPVLTERTNSERLRLDKLLAHVVEAAEQCGATYVPQIEEPRKLAVVLKDWPAGRHLYFCDETRDSDLLSDCIVAGPAAILIGPEGGFSPDEIAQIKAQPQARPVALGPRILRAETAAIAAVTLWQAKAGDWQ